MRLPAQTRTDTPRRSSSDRFGNFDAPYVWTALAIAIAGGFAIATYLGWQLGTQSNLPTNFPVWVQVHGQLQLVGWVDLFIMGVSLFFMPRLLVLSQLSGR